MTFSFFTMKYFLMSKSEIQRVITRDGKRIILNTLSDFPGVTAAWLYGSANEGSYREDSDIDIGILAEDEFGLQDLVTLSDQLSRAVGFDAIDLKNLKSQPIALQCAIVSGSQLFVRDVERTAEVFSMVVRLYEDSQILLRRSLELLKKSRLS
jgi:uncharacterized protein